MASLGDPVEALAFVGKPMLPAEVHGALKAGDWAIDVGANVGVLTAELCHIVGPSGCVWAIEPFPPNVLKLDEMRVSNDLRALRIFQGALSSRKGVASLGLPDDANSGHPSLSKTSGLVGAMDVDVWTLDSMVAADRPSGRLGFIKIDVEGHELAVLEGARQTIVEMGPLILCEFNQELLIEGGSSGPKLLEVFAGMGYRPISAFREGRRLSAIARGRSPWTSIDLETTVVDLLLAKDGV